MATESVKIPVRVSDDGPYIRDIDDLMAKVGEAQSHQLPAAQGGSGGYKYLMKFDSGSSDSFKGFNANSRTLNGTPFAMDEGNRMLELIVVDSAGDSFCREFLVEVTDDTIPFPPYCPCAAIDEDLDMKLPKAPFDK